MNRVLSTALLCALVQLATTAAVEARSFIWQIEGRTSSNTSYLVGSIHMAKKELYPLPEAMERSFSRSEVLVVEARVDEVAKLLPMVMQQAMYRPPDTLDKHISKKTLVKLKARLKVLGLPAAAILQLKPWVIAMTLSALEMKKMGFDTASGIDMYFLKKASGKKKIDELEGAEFQLKLFADLSDKEQEEFLLYTLNQSKKFRTYIKKIVRFWKRGDGVNLHKLISLSAGKSPSFRKIYRKLIIDRNIRMANRIEKMLKKGKAPHFIVVGAGHVTGPKGLVRLLKSKGFSLKQL